MPAREDADLENARLGRALRHWRQARRLTQQQVADLDPHGDWTQADVSAVEHGRRPLGIQRAARVEHAAGDPPGTILRLAGYCQPPGNWLTDAAQDTRIPTHIRQTIIDLAHPHTGGRTPQVIGEHNPTRETPPDPDRPGGAAALRTTAEPAD